MSGLFNAKDGMLEVRQNRIGISLAVSRGMEVREWINVIANRKVQK